jgi:hypothetical protein
MRGFGFNKELGPQLDITGSETDVEITIRPDGKVLWVSMEGITVLRICRIEGEIQISRE